MISKLLKEDNLAEGALGIGGILKGTEDLLESEDLARLFVLNLPDNTISLKNDLLTLKDSRLCGLAIGRWEEPHSLAKLLEDLETIQNVLVNLLVSSHV